jgi:death-on-curing protein
VNEPVWVAKTVVLAIHDEQIGEHGGLTGIRDMGLLDSALARPQNLFHYEGLDLIEIGAAYGYAITQNHPFNDGNKRVSAVVTELFLTLNGVEITASDDEVVTTWLALASGQIDENQFVSWLRAHIG